VTKMETEIILMFAMLLSLAFAIMSVFVPIAALATFLINYGYLVFNLETVVGMRELIIMVLVATTLIGFFGVYQVERG
jgi:hypothetical protein